MVHVKNPYLSAAVHICAYLLSTWAQLQVVHMIVDLHHNILQYVALGLKEVGLHTICKEGHI